MKILVSLVTVFTLFLSNGTSTEKQTITATVVNVTSDSGKVYFSLYNKEDFMKKPLQTASAIVKDGKSTVVFKGVESGEYAIICYHDKNSNNKMDFAPNGRPMENYGSSNNVMTMGPPQFDTAKFIVADKNVSFDIKF